MFAKSSTFTLPILFLAFVILPTTTTTFVLNLPNAACRMRDVLERAQSKHDPSRTTLPGNKNSVEGHQSVNCSWALNRFASDSKVVKGQVTNEVLQEVVQELPVLWTGTIGDEKEMCLLWVGLWERLEL